MSGISPAMPCLRFSEIPSRTIDCSRGIVPENSWARHTLAGPDRGIRRSGRFGRRFAQFRPVGLLHSRLQVVPGERLGKQLANLRLFVRVVDLVAAEPPADPGLRHALLVADRGGFVLERELARRYRA